VSCVANIIITRAPSLTPSSVLCPSSSAAGDAPLPLPHFPFFFSLPIDALARVICEEEEEEEELVGWLAGRE
jgi:hypothetical protein